jgi:8-oxo-dGTP pyrophosphatase MutT (NUDIX family)
VAGLLVHAGHVVLVKHRAHAFWLLPGGRLDGGESLVDCVIREFREETGLRVCSQGPIFLGDFLSGKKHIVDIIFRVALAGSEEGLPRIRVGADAGLADARWFPLQSVPEVGPPPLGDLLVRTGFVPENVWGRFAYGGTY